MAAATTALLICYDVILSVYLKHQQQQQHLQQTILKLKLEGPKILRHTKLRFWISLNVVQASIDR